MKRKMFEVYQSDLKAGDIPWELRDFGWVTDFGVDSLVNLALRRSDAENFAVLNEGNLYNNLFDKVNLEYIYLIVIDNSKIRLTEYTMRVAKQMENIVNSIMI